MTTRSVQLSCLPKSHDAGERGTRDGNVSVESPCFTDSMSACTPCVIASGGSVTDQVYGPVGVIQCGRNQGLPPAASQSHTESGSPAAGTTRASTRSA